MVSIGPHEAVSVEAAQRLGLVGKKHTEDAAA
jgi:hypothetical protein